MGMGSAVARVGLMTTPFVAQWLDNLNLLFAMSICKFLMRGFDPQSVPDLQLYIRARQTLSCCAILFAQMLVLHSRQST